MSLVLWDQIRLGGRARAYCFSRSQLFAAECVSVKECMKGFLAPELSSFGTLRLCQFSLLHLLGRVQFLHSWMSLRLSVWRLSVGKYYMYVIRWTLTYLHRWMKGHRNVSRSLGKWTLSLNLQWAHPLYSLLRAVNKNIRICFHLAGFVRSLDSVRSQATITSHEFLYG